MGAPAAVVAGRFAWVSYRDRLGLVPARLRKGAGDTGPPSDDEASEVEVVRDVDLGDTQPAGARAPEPAGDEGHPATPSTRGEAGDRLVGSPG